MKRLWKGFRMAIGMYTIFPQRKAVWEDDCTNLMIPYFPVMGLIIGGVWYLISWILSRIAVMPELLQVMLLVISLPFFSGFLHMDGFMDTSDAICSRRELKERQLILKDSHVGAFGVIALILYFMLMIGGVQGILESGENPIGFIFIPIISRCIAGSAILSLKPMSENSYAHFYQQKTKPIHKFMVILIGAATISATIVTTLVIGNYKMVAVVLVELLIGILTTFYTYRQLGGISGDLSGCIVTVCELGGVLALALI